MSVKLSGFLKDRRRTGRVAPSIREYEDRYGQAKRSEFGSSEHDFKKFAEIYYDLVTDFYEFGWGKSFHFAPRVAGESLEASLARHEHYLAHKLGLRTRDGRR